MSFSAEMKDFLNAYKTGTDINTKRTDQDYKEQLTASAKGAEDRASDPDTLDLQQRQGEATLAATKDRMATAAAQRALIAQHIAVLKQQQQGGGGSGLMPPGAINPGAPQGAPQPGTGGAPAPQGGALPIGPSTMDTDAYAGGGYVPPSGAVDPDDDGTDDVATDPASLEGVPTPADAPTDLSSRGRTPRGLDGVIAPQSVHDAVLAGGTYGAKEYGLHQTGAVLTPAMQARADLYARGHGGLSDAEMDAARKAVDPTGKLTDSQRNMAALGSVYQYWNNKGDGDKAQRVAFQMLQHFRNATTTYASIAAHAAQGGNLPLAAKAMVKAYANVPDGKDMSIEVSPDDPKRLIAYATDEHGNDIAKGIVTPQELASSAMGLASGGFDKAILTAAGQREAAATPAKGGKAQTASDRAKEAELSASEVGGMKDAAAAKDPKAPVDNEYWSELHSNSQHMMQQNPHMTAGEAVRSAKLMMDPGTKDPEKPDFTVTPGEEGQPHTIKFNGGQTAQLDDNQLNAVLTSRAARVKAATDKINADMEAQDNPSRTSQAIDLAGDAASHAGSAIKADWNKGVQQVKNHIPDELMTRGKSAIEAAQRAGVDVKEYISRLLSEGSGIGKIPETMRGAVPVDDNARTQ